MSAQTIKSTLGHLQDDPDNNQAWQSLREQLSGESGLSGLELGKLLESARKAHEARREAEAVARVLEAEVAAARGTPREPELLAELARVVDEDLLDDERARGVLDRLIALPASGGGNGAEAPPSADSGLLGGASPGAAETRRMEALEAKERSSAKRAKWSELVDRYTHEASRTSDAVFRSSLLVSAAETIYRYGREGAERQSDQRIAGLLREALSLDPKNRRAEMLLERVLREQSRWDDLTAALERFATEVTHKDEKIAAWIRLARVFGKRLGSPDRAAAAYERVVKLSPGDREAVGFLSEHFTSHAMWEHLVALYEEQLSAGALRSREEEFGVTLQIAMVHWRMRGRLDSAEPWFEKARKIEPAHPGILAFFREWCSARNDSGRLSSILADAQRALADGPDRTALVADIARLAEEGENPQKAIEQWRALLRQDPQNREAREALKRLYRTTGSHGALADLLRQDIEKLAPDDAAGRLATLREIASVYRDHIKSDSALVGVLTQIVPLDPTDLVSVRELARVYEALARWRDLLATQARQAELEPDKGVKARLWRSVARRWLEQFSNVQNALEAYEKLHAVDPADVEANDKLRELYVKRRAYRPLYDLLRELSAATPEGRDRRETLMEMAKLASERLDLGAESIALYKRVLEEDPAHGAALDALERQAERDKDFATLADVLERRAAVGGDTGARLAVLQKLGAVYSERLHDPEKAQSAWRRVLVASPGHPKALRVLRDAYLAAGDYDGLSGLYGQNGDWEGLVEVLSGAADKAADPDLKVELSFRCAALYVDRLAAPDRAFRAYERILSVRPADARAAAALVPLYEADERWGRLPGLYEVLLGHAEDVDQQLGLLAKLVRVNGQELQDRPAAFKWAVRAYELASERRGALEQFERPARSSGQWSAFVDALNARIAALDLEIGAARPKRRKKRESESADILRVEERRTLRAKVAEVYARELGLMDEAVRAYRSLVEEDDTDEQAVQTLHRLLRESDRRDDLRWLYELRVDRANTALKLDLLAEWAVLEEQSLGAPERAIGLYRRILEIVPQHGAALRSLARLLRAQGDAHGAAEVLAIDRDQRQGAERAAHEVELARLYFDPLGRYNDALAAAERALSLVPNEPQATAVVERLLGVAQTRARAAAILERAYDETGAARQQADVLEVLIGTSASSGDRQALHLRLADVLERKLSDADAAFDVVARAASEYPTEFRMWDRLSALADQTGRAEGLVDAIAAVVPPEGPTGLPESVETELAQRAATLYDEKLGQVDRARPYLERVLERDPGNEHAFQRLKQVLTTHEQWGELGTLYERIVLATVDPARRAELLTEVALISEEITGEKPKAIGYYERILELEPGHEHALRSLDTLYAAEQRWNSLADLLRSRLAGTSGDARLELQQRLGTLLFVRLGDAVGALSYLEPVLRRRPGATESRLLVERIMELPELRSQAAAVLEAVYTERDDVSNLVRVLEIHLEFAGTGTLRRDILRRVAQLRDERLRDDSGALEAFARLLPLDPDDVQARERFLEIASRTGAQERAAGVLVATSSAAAPPLPRTNILMDLAHLYERNLGDETRAEHVYRQVLDLAPTDASIALPACRALERIYAKGNAEKLREILRIEVALEDRSETRRELRGRLGELCESIGDPNGAIDAWQARLEGDPHDAQALSALDRLYVRTERWRDLVDVLRARERSANDPGERRALMVRIATALADKLGDVDEAVLSYRAVVEEFGADRLSLSSLAALYEGSGLFRDLADVLEADLALAETPSEKLALLSRLGDVRKEKLGDVQEAIEAYREALTLDPAHARARAALEALLDEQVARREAGAILKPLYEADGLHERLLRVLEIEAEFADSNGARLATIAQAAAVVEGPLGDPERALQYAARGLKEAVAEPELPLWIERAERLAAATGKYAALADLFRAAVGEIIDVELALTVTLRIAEIAKTRLGDAHLAKTYYVRALELRGDDARALKALESLYEETRDYPALLDIVKRRAEVAESDADRAHLLFKQAHLSDEKLGDPSAAVAVYEQILDLGLNPEAIAALERLYEQGERWPDLVALYERQIGSPGVSNERRAALHHALGNVLEKRTGEVDRAFEEYSAALAIDPRHPRAIASLESLMGAREHSARAATMLEPVYLARLDWRSVMATLGARLAVSQDPDERRSLLRRLSKLHEEQEENYVAALEVTAELLGEDLTAEGTWAELERLARVANAEGRLAEIYARELGRVASDEPATARLSKRTGQLFEAQGAVDRALVFYRRAHAFDPESDAESFAAIDRLLQTGRRPGERVELYRESLEYKSIARDRLAALHAIAEIQKSELADEAGAIETYRAALEVDEGDLSSLDALSTLYARGGRHHDLAELTRRRAEQSALAEDEARFRMDLAVILIDRLGEVNSGIDELQAVVELAPQTKAGVGREAVSLLERLLGRADHKARAIDLLRPIYEREDDWRHLVSLNEERLGIAATNGERIAILRESALLWERRGRESAKAFDAMRAAWTLDPEDGDAREQIERLANITGRWDDLADAYELAIAKTQGLTRRELLSSLARLHDTHRDDPRKALDAWERLFEQDETELEPLDEMDALATLLSDWETLVRVLTKKAELVLEDARRASTWRRVGEAKRDMLDDADGAIDAYERALDLEPTSTLTIDYLVALYEHKKDAARLVELYRRRVDLCEEHESALRFQLLVEASTRYERDLSDRRNAIECLMLALAVQPDDAGVLRRLDGLYAHERLWPELLDNLKAQSERAPDEVSRRKLNKRIAALYAVELQDPQAALEAYGSVLADDFDEESAAAIRTIGESRDDLRAGAADALEPVLRREGKYDEVAAVLELRLRALGEPELRAHTLRALADVAEGPLRDDVGAQAALIRALVEDPGDPSLHEQIERLAGKLGEPGWKRYAEALQERAGATFDAHLAADLFVRLGRISEERLGEPERAATAYVAAVERMGDDAGVLAALDRLFTRLGENRRLAEVLERRVAIELEPAVQAELLYRLGSLQAREFSQPGQALATFREALDRVPEHEASHAAIAAFLADDALFDDAFEALESVYAVLGRSEDTAKLYERRVFRAETIPDRTRARLDLARTLEDLVGDKVRAQRAIESAVGENASDEDALSQLERLAAVNGAWGEAAETLRAALDASPDLSHATRTELWVRLARWRRDQLGEPLGAEAAFARALTLDPENIDVVRSIEEIRRAKGRERDLVGTLRMRARLETDLATKKDLLREAKSLAEDPVGDRDLAEGALRDLLNEDDGDLWALEELTKTRRAVGDDGERVKLLIRRAELLGHGPQSLELRHDAAAVLLDRLAEPVQATALYEEILNSEPEDARAASALRLLYDRAGRHQELARLLRQLIDLATSQSDRTELRLELAKLEAGRFQSTEAAIETLRAILDENVSEPQAVLQLSQLYEASGRDAALADLLKSQLDAARDRGDVPAELALLVRLADVQERRLGDLDAAQATYDQVLERDPVHKVALESVARLAQHSADWDRASGALSTLVDLATSGSGVAWALRLAEVNEQRGDVAGTELALSRGLELDPSNPGLRTMLRARWERTERWAELAELLVGDADLLSATTPSAVGISAEPGPLATATLIGRPPPVDAMGRPSPVEALPRVASTAPPARGSMAPPGLAVSPAVNDQVKLLREAADIQIRRLQSPHAAIPLLERAAALVPYDRELLLVLCDAYNSAHRGRDAARVLERVIASFGTRRTKELALYHHRLGRALALLGDKELALAQLDMAFRIDPGSVSVLRDLGVMAFETGDFDRAQKTFRALLLQRLDASSGISKGEVFYYLGEISAKQGDRVKAAQMFERAVENDPSLTRARAKLAEFKG